MRFSFLPRRRTTSRLLRALVDELRGIRVELVRANDARDQTRRVIHGDPRPNVFVTGTAPAGVLESATLVEAAGADPGTLADYYEVAQALRSVYGREPSEDEVEAEYQLRKLPLAARPWES